MKILVLILSVSLFGSLLIMSCSDNSASFPSGPIGSPRSVTPVSGTSSTATPGTTPASGIAVTVTYGGSYNFKPTTVTITHGQSVVWDSTFNGIHTLYIDGFSGSMTPGSGCGTPLVNTTTFPVTQVFSTPGTYYYHCANHSGCGSTQCGVCTGGYGMVGSVVVN